MSDSPAPGRGPLRLVAPSPDGRRVLARPNGLAGWALPTIAVDVPFFQWSEAEVERAVRALGTPTVPVRRLAPDAWEVEVRERVPAAGTTWIGIDEVERLGVDATPARTVLGEEPSEQGHLRPGWLADLEAWIDERFARTGPVTLHCHWELSAVVSFAVDDGRVVVKQNGPGFTREGQVLDALAAVEHVPPVLAVDDDIVATGWAGVAGVDRPTIAATLGRLHRDAEDRVPALLTAGCPTTDDLARSLGRADVQPHLEAVHRLGLAPTVVHADAHGGNVLAAGDVVTVIDWTDAVVGDPVLDLSMLLLPDTLDPSPDAAAVIEAWANAYGTDPAPVLAALPSVTVVACAVTVALYDLHVGDLPSSARPWWDDWTDSWRRRLDTAVSTAGTR